MKGATFKDGFLVLDKFSCMIRPPGRPSRTELEERDRVCKLRKQLEMEMHKVEARRAERGTAQKMPSSAWHNPDKTPTRLDASEGEKNSSRLTRQESLLPEDSRIDSGREDDEGRVEVADNDGGFAAKRKELHHTLKKQSRDRKKQVDTGPKKRPRESLLDQEGDRALNNIPNTAGDAESATAAENNLSTKPKDTTTELRIDSGKEDSHCSSAGSSAPSEGAALIDVPDTDGTPTKRRMIRVDRMRKEATQQTAKEFATAPRRRKRALSTAKFIPVAQKRRGCPPLMSTLKTPRQFHVSPTNKRQRGNAHGESPIASLNIKEATLDGRGEDSDKIRPKVTSRKKRSAKAPTAVPVRRLACPTTGSLGQAQERTTENAEDEEKLPVTIPECQSAIVRLRSKLRTTEDMLRSEVSRAGELEEALGLDIQYDAPSSSEHERVVNLLAQRDRELRQRAREVAEKDEIIREKNAAMRGYVEQIRELERSQGGNQYLDMVRITELEDILAERESTIRRLRKMTERYEAGLKSVAKANRDLQKRVYSLNKVLRGATAADE